MNRVISENGCYVFISLSGNKWGFSKLSSAGIPIPDYVPQSQAINYLRLMEKKDEKI